MKKLLAGGAFLLLSTSLFGLWLAPRARAASAVKAQQTIESRVAALELELAAEKKKNEDTRTLVEQTVRYLESQGHSAKAVLTVLDESEREGFTPGINFRSREILLAGLRAYWTGAQQGLPKAPAAGAPAAAQGAQQPARTPRQ
jgi:hypothetical protein